MGPKKTKGKGSKLARMSDEERVRYLQHRAAVEEEARRRKQQLVATFMKNQLKKEEGFARLNVAKINQHWWQILRAVKSQQLRHQLKHLWQSIEHVLEQKQQMVDLLLAGLRNAEEQYSKGWRYHAEMLDRLLVLQEQRLWNLRADYDAERQRLVKGAQFLAQGLHADCTATEEQLTTVTHLLATRAAADHLTHCLRHRATLHDVTHAAVAGEEQLQTAGQCRTEKLWRQFQQVLSDYAAATESLLGVHARLRERDVQSTQTIAWQRKHVEELQHQVGVLHARAAGGEEHQVAQLVAKRRFLEQVFWRMRQQLELVHMHDEQQLTVMTVSSNQVIKKLQSLAGKGEHILSMAALCRKLETQQEKVMPFGYQTFLLDDDLKDGDDFLALDVVGSLQGLWERYNHAYLQHRALVLHHKSLSLQNERLRHELRRYLGAVNDQSALAVHTRLCATAVQRRSCLVAVLPGRRKPTPATVPCVVEGSMCCAVRWPSLSAHLHSNI